MSCAKLATVKLPPILPLVPASRLSRQRSSTAIPSFESLTFYPFPLDPFPNAPLTIPQPRPRHRALQEDQARTGRAGRRRGGLGGRGGRGPRRRAARRGHHVVGTVRAADMLQVAKGTSDRRDRLDGPRRARELHLHRQHLGRRPGDMRGGRGEVLRRRRGACEGEGLRVVGVAPRGAVVVVVWGGSAWLCWLCAHQRGACSLPLRLVLPRILPTYTYTYSYSYTNTLHMYSTSTRSFT